MKPMADIHQLIVTCIIYLYQLYVIFRSIHPLKKDALLLVLHNILLYYVINMFKHFAQGSIDSPGPVNTFYYVPLVYEETVGSVSHPDKWHQVLRSSSWQFFETLFRHHLALLLSFTMALMVPRCKLGFISTLVLASNFVMFVCFTSAICQLLMVSGQASVNVLRLFTILGLGPVCQVLLGCRLLSRMWWQLKPRSPFFLAYRWILGACFGTGFVSNTVIYFQRGHTFIYLTNLGFLLCAVTSVSGALLVTVYHCKEESWVPPRCLVKTYWACYWINLCVAHLVSIIYWACIYPSDRVASSPTYVSTLFNIWTHAMQLICFTIDHFVVAQPARLLHFVYPIGFCFLYLGFTVVFYFAGGRDLKGHRYIYKILDYSKPRKVVGTVALVTLMLAACSTLQYGVYRLRTFVARKCGKLLV